MKTTVKGYQPALKNKDQLEFLGLDEQKGFIYSEYLYDGKYRIIALKDGTITELIRFKGEVKQVEDKEEEAI